MTTDPVQDLVASVRADLRDALKRRDRVAMSALREILSIIDNAGAVEAAQGYDYSGVAPTEVARRTVGIDEVRARLQGAVAERLEAAGAYRALEQGTRADDLEREAALVTDHLDGSA